MFTKNNNSNSTINYFADCQNVADVKKLYRQLALKNHPDKGGDTATMQRINAQYTLALKRFDGTKSEDGYTYKYNAATEAAAMEKINELLKTKINVDIQLIGQWVWVSGETKKYKDTLKALKFQWHAKRGCWFWRSEEYRANRQSRKDLSAIALKYGCTEFFADAEANMARA